MDKIKMTAGMTWALVCLVFMIVFYFGLGSFATGFSKLPFMKLNPNTSGGEVAGEVVMDNCTLVIRKPVFEGFLGERRKGFVQVDWRGEVSENINDTVDFNFDQIPDFNILINRDLNDASLIAFNPVVKDIGISTPTSYGWSVRVRINK